MHNINNNKIIIGVCLAMIIAGTFILAHPYLSSKKDIAYDNITFQIYNEEILKQLDEKTPDDPEPEQPESPDPEPITPDPTTPKPTEPSKPDPKNDYIGTIEIEKIKLKKGFVDPSSKYNDISYNVTIIKGYTFPDVDKGNFILAAHSGSGPIAFFKDLYKLDKGDKINIIYKNEEYIYKIVKIYNQKKQGYVTINRDINKTTLTLITCTKNDKTSQTVYIAELV